MTSPIIGTLSEKSLHKSLKDYYSAPTDAIEQKLEGYVIDIARDDLLIEIQTGSFSNIKKKLEILLPQYKILLVFPIHQIKWIVRIDIDNNEISRRKSPKRGKIEHLFKQLVYLPTVMNQRNFAIEVVLIEAEELWKDDGNGSWRRKGWSIFDRRLVRVVDQHRFATSSDLLDLIPSDTLRQFTNKSLATELKLDYKTAQNMTYCLRHLGEIEIAEKNGNSYVYQRSND